MPNILLYLKIHHIIPHLNPANVVVVLGLCVDPSLHTTEKTRENCITENLSLSHHHHPHPFHRQQNLKKVSKAGNDREIIKFILFYYTFHPLKSIQQTPPISSPISKYKILYGGARVVFTCIGLYNILTQVLYVGTR